MSQNVPLFSFPRMTLIICSLLPLLLAGIESLMRGASEHFSPFFWIGPMFVVAAGVMGLIVQAPGSSGAARVLLVTTNILVMLLTACGLAAALGFIQFRDNKDPLALIVINLFLLLPGWLNLLAASMLPPPSSEGNLY